MSQLMMWHAAQGCMCLNGFRLGIAGGREEGIGGLPGGLLACG